jgi:orotidine-5'-phosphate decarboxylase
MLGKWNDQQSKDRIIIALDCEADKALSIAYQLHKSAKWVKIGMTLYYAYGDDLVKMLKERGYKVFLDLKFFDIPHQVRGAARSATLSGADMLTMHCLGGTEMMEQACVGISEAAEVSGSQVPETLGITVLTSMNDAMLKNIGIERDMASQVSHLASLAQMSGLSGVVASPQESSMLRQQLGSDALIVTPGVRPAGADSGDQSRIATPKQAFLNGASHIVIGRPITGADDPVSAFEKIASEL